jgi:hypothetical protein
MDGPPYYTLKEAAQELRKSERMPRFFKINEVAKALGKSESALCRWLDTNASDDPHNPFCRLAGRIKLFRQEDIDRMRLVIDSQDRIPTFIYFVEVAAHIKIGRADNWRRRIIQIKTCNPLEVKTLLILRGTIGFERQLHEEFAEYHVRGEWFRDVPTIRDFIHRASKTKSVYSPGRKK